MKIELTEKESAAVRFLVQRELKCFEQDERVEKQELRMLGAQEAYHDLLTKLAKKLK